MVPERLVVARQAEHVPDAVGGGAQQVGLHREPIAVAAGDLDDRFQTRAFQQDGAADAAHAHDRGLVVGDVGRVEAFLDDRASLADDLRVVTLRRLEFAGYREVARRQNALEIYIVVISIFSL